jgi:hypothetical protein
MNDLKACDLCSLQFDEATDVAGNCPIGSNS